MNLSIDNIVDNLRYYRHISGLTQQELGERISYSGKSISKWESGYSLPPIDAIIRLADTFEIDMNLLFIYRKKPIYFLGVDGGGTKTEFVLADSDNNIIKRSRLDACNIINMDINDVTNVLANGVNEVCAGIPLEQVSAFFGIAGAGSVEPGIIQTILRRFNFSYVDCGSDAKNIVSAGLHGQDGIIAILGTGSSIHVSVSGTLTRFGGYGHLLGDCASGYEIGRCGLTAILRNCDGTGPDTMLTQLFEEKTNKNIFEVLPVFYKRGKPYIASFAPMVFDAYQKDDAIAKEIISDNISQFASQIKVASKLLDGRCKIPLVISGGLTSSFDIIRSFLEKEIQDSRIVIQLLNEEPVMGAVGLARLLHNI